MPPLRTPYISDDKRGAVDVVHEPKGIKLIKNIVAKYKPELILELGTSWGGLTMVLRDAAPEATLYSYDRKTKARTPTRLLRAFKNVHVVFCDLLKEPFQPLVDKCKDKRRKVLYCDNGNKIKEVLMYGVHLNVGDLLGIHDWPGEFNFVHEKLDYHHKERNTPEEVRQLKKLITENFIPHFNNEFEVNKCSTRMWIRRK